MKTPRELLLERHRSVMPQLDAIRRGVLADLPVRTDREVEAPTGFVREFFLPLRWHLAAMSALWIFAALLNIDRSAAVSQTAGQSISRQVLVALFENRRQVAEMIASPADDSVTAPLPQPPVVPRRRSALQPMSVIV
jgi:hypothetical protein